MRGLLSRLFARSEPASDASWPPVPDRQAALYGWFSFLLALLLATALALVALALAAAREQNRLELSNERQLVGAVLGERLTGLGATARDYSVWSEAYQNLVARFDPAWAANNINEALNKTFGITRAIVVAPGNTPIHFVRGTEVVPAGQAAPLLTGDVLALLQRARRLAPAGSTPAHGLIRLPGGALYLGAAAAIWPQGSNPTPAQARGTAIFAVMVPFTDRYLDSISPAFGIRGLTLTAATGGRDVLVLHTIRGAPAIGVTWNPRKPGTTFLRFVLPPVAMVLFLAFVFGVIAQIGLRRSAAMIQAASAQAQASGRRLAQAQQMVRVGSCVIAWPEGTLRYASETLATVFGRPYDSILAQLPDLSEYVHPDDRMLYTRKRARPSGTDQAMEYRILLPGGEQCQIAEQSRLVRDAGGDPIETIITYQDITDRKIIEQQIREALHNAAAASESKSIFLANMSHELRTPLNAIIGFSEALDANVAGPLRPRQREYLNHIRDSGTHLLRVINDILDLSKMDAGGFSITPEPCDLSQVAREALSMMHDLAVEQGLLLEEKLAADLPEIEADPARLRQVVLNLLSNAIKFTPEGGRIRVETAFDTGRVSVCVSDTGIGIPEEKLSLALERFGQIDSGLARRYQGTGLGLPVSKRIVEMHGGTFILESKVGVGTTATASFAVPAQAVRARPQGAGA